MADKRIIFLLSESESESASEFDWNWQHIFSQP